MAKTQYDSINKQITDEAAEWFVEFSTDAPDAEARRAFDNWLRKSPDHIHAYLEMFSIWEDAPLVDPAKTMVNADVLIALTRDVDQTVVSIAERSMDESRGSARQSVSKRTQQVNRGWYAFAASVALAVAGIGGWFYLQRNTYTTETAEQRLITLPDGSEIELNARSKIRVGFTDEQRRIELLAGQALFKVAKEAQRGFIVESGDTEVRAVGTQFDVYRKRSGTTVTVVEGRVAVHANQAGRGSENPLPIQSEKKSAVAEPRRSLAPTAIADRQSSASTIAREILLAAGEQLVITPTAISKAEHADIGAATAWRERRLVFTATPLTEVVEEFNRYNSRQLIVRTASLDSFNVSAVFSATDLPSLLRFLRAQPGITVEESDTEIHLFEN